MPSGLRPISFERRLLEAETPVGTAFQSFVGECLARADFSGSRMRTYAAAGRDGGIDLVVDMAKGRAVLECKFHADSRDDKPVSDWRATARNLDRNLQALALEPAEVVARSPYAPWLDTENPIVAYWFCTSARLSHENEAQQIKAEIAAFFATLAGKSERLRHLAKVAVEVRSWTDFGQVLGRFPAIRYRWFGGLPAGLSFLQDRSGQSKSFRRFLDQEDLPYFGVDSFAAQHPAPGAESFPSVEQLLDRLLSSSRGSLVIGGAGGLGKTRMALEIGRAAARRNLLTLAAKPFMDANSLQKLAADHADPADILILLDYAEVFDSLDHMVAAIDDLAERGYGIHLVATCRNSALSRVSRAMADLRTDTVVLEDFKASDGVTYPEWVVGCILDLPELRDGPQLGELCKGFPVLAAFAFYLKRELPEEFGAQFASLSANVSFEQWVRTRLHATFGGRTSALPEWPRRLAALAACLDLSPAEVRQLRDETAEGAQLLEILESDQWFESHDDGYSAAHDVFADAIVAQYLFEDGKPAQARLNDLLSDADRLGGLARSLTLLDRLASHPDAHRLQLLPALERRLSANPRALADSSQAVLRSRLLETPQVIGLLGRDPLLVEAVRNDRDADGHLGRLAKSVTEGDEALRDLATPVLAPLLANALAKPQPTNMMLRRAFELLPDTYREAVRTAIQAAPLTHDAHYLLAAWARQGQGTDFMAEETVGWLERWCGSSSKASYVITQWLMRTRDHAAVADATRIWLSRHSQSPEAVFVLSAWLEYGGGAALVSAPLKAWLGSFGSQRNAAFAFTGWIAAGGPLEHIAAEILVWLDMHAADIAASRGLQSWIEGGGDLPAIEEHLEGWLESHGTRPEAGFVFRSLMRVGISPSEIEGRFQVWLDINSAERTSSVVVTNWLEHGGKLSTVRPHILRWLDHHGDLISANYVLQSWLAAGEDIETVRPYLRVWLDAHRATVGARYVYRNWFRSGGDVQEVARSLHEWVKEHGGSEEADFLYQAWLDAGGDFDLVRDGAISWFLAHKTQEKCLYMTKHIVRQQDLPLPVVVELVQWCHRFRELPDAICRFAPLMSYAADEKSRRILGDICLDILERLDDEDLDDVGITHYAMAAMTTLNFWLHKLGADRSVQQKRVDSLYLLFMLKLQTDAEKRSFASLPRNAGAVVFFSGLLQRGLLSPHRDRAAIQAFFDWLGGGRSTDLKAGASAIRHLMGKVKGIVIPASMRAAIKKDDPGLGPAGP